MSSFKTPDVKAWASAVEDLGRAVERKAGKTVDATLSGLSAGQDFLDFLGEAGDGAELLSAVMPGKKRAPVLCGDCGEDESDCAC